MQEIEREPFVCHEIPLTGPNGKRGLLKRLVVTFGSDFAGLTGREGLRDVRLKLKGLHRFLTVEGHEEAVKKVRKNAFFYFL